MMSPIHPTIRTPDCVDLFEHAPVGYMLLDAAGSIEKINHTGAAILSWDQSWLVGKPFVRWVANDDKQLFRAHLRRLCDCEGCISEDLRIKNRQGQFVSLRLKSTRETRQSKGAVGCRSIMIDISGEQQSARRLRRLQSHLAHVARLNTAGELATSLAHELNQPLGTVVLNCETAQRLLNSGLGKENELAEVLVQATEAASFASDVIRHLRSFLHKNDEEHQVCELPTLIRDITTLIEIDAKDNDIALKLDIERNMPSVRVDPVQIGQVLVNLAHNSIEAISENGEVGQNEVVIRARHEAPNKIRVSVEDTGPGLEAKHIDRVFSPFYTTKSNGMGMGLSISRSIIEAHGGKLWATNEFRGGAILRFTLPTIQGRQHAV